MLEDSHSISLSATMSSELWASIDSARGSTPTPCLLVHASGGSRKAAPTPTPAPTPAPTPTPTLPLVPCVLRPCPCPFTRVYPAPPGALRRHLKRVSEELRMAAAEEVNSLVAATLADAEHDGPAASSRTLAGMPLQVGGVRMVLRGVCSGGCWGSTQGAC
jgi:hypothetical protein